MGNREGNEIRGTGRRKELLIGEGNQLEGAGGRRLGRKMNGNNVQ